MREEVISWLNQTLIKMNIEVNNMKFDEDMDIQGINSLQFIQLIVYTETEFDIEVEDEYLEVGKMRTLDQLIDYILERK